MPDPHAYRAITDHIEVTVEPHFIEQQSDPDESQFVWAYRVEIINHGAVPVQLRNRHWVITDGFGRQEEVVGPGVVGEEPHLQPGDSFTYMSGCPLSTPSGTMVGSYEMERPDGSRFNVAIPAFSLDSPHTQRVLN